MERLFGSIPAVLRELGADSQLKFAMVLAAWADAAGEMIAERTEVVALFDSRLVVAVEDATWQRHLESFAPRLMAKLSAAVGQNAVTFIEFRIEPIRGELPPPEESATFCEVGDGLAAASEKIADESLRRTFLEAAERYLTAQSIKL